MSGVAQDAIELAKTVVGNDSNGITRNIRRFSDRIRKIKSFFRNIVLFFAEDTVDMTLSVC